jgi:hypothetical protein
MSEKSRRSRQEEEEEESQEKDILYVLRRPDGSVFAELMMTPSLAEKINTRRRKRGVLTGDWVPQEINQYGLWHLDEKRIISDIFSLTKDEFERLNSTIIPEVRVRWVETKATHGLETN